ncbi:MAG TPA: type VI secretion system tip protein VgrG [Chitinophagaceae bacterium]
MATNATPEVKQATDVVSQKVLINGTALSGEARVNAISVNTLHNKISTATIVIHDGDVSSREFKLSNSETFKPGNEIEIKFGYHGEVESVFKGIITKHALRAKQKASSYLYVEAKNKAVKLTVGRKNKYFFDKKDSDIIAEICKSAGVTNEVSSTKLTHKEMVQYYVTDWDFIIQRAEANAMLAFTDLDKLIIKKPDAGSDAVLTATYGDNIFEFETEMDARQHFKSIKSYSWNAADQKIEQSEEGDFSFTNNGNLNNDDLSKVIGLKELSLHHAGDIKDEELNQWATAWSMKNKLSKICGKIKVLGNAKVKPGAVITIKGMSDRFNGNVFVTGVQHQFSVNNWFTVIQFGWNNEWFYKKEDIIEKPSSGLVPGINGLHTGIVTKLEQDPEGNFRIKVKVPLIDEHEDGIWARIATLDAGKERGSFFLPELKDEVLLGFINDDPRQAVVLGMLNSKTNTAPVTASDKNNEKGFYTRSKMKLFFDDDKKSITIITPKEKSIVISDQDGSIILKDELNNKITMNSDGISIESMKDIKLKATGQIKAEGTAKIELTSSGQAVLKGTVVNIN